MAFFEAGEVLLVGARLGMKPIFCRVVVVGSPRKPCLAVWGPVLGRGGRYQVVKVTTIVFATKTHIFCTARDDTVALLLKVHQSKFVCAKMSDKEQPATCASTVWLVSGNLL